VRPSGVNAAAAFSLMFFQNAPVGLRISEDFMNIDAQDGDTRLLAKLYMTSAQLSVNFDFSGNRHSIGFGYAKGIVGNQSAEPSTYTFNRDQVQAILFEGRDMWLIGRGGNQYVFLSGKLFIPVRTSGHTGLIGLFMIGFDL
jgi:hypothetical protein